MVRHRHGMLRQGARRLAGTRQIKSSSSTPTSLPVMRHIPPSPSGTAMPTRSQSGSVASSRSGLILGRSPAAPGSGPPGSQGWDRGRSGNARPAGAAPPPHARPSRRSPSGCAAHIPGPCRSGERIDHTCRGASARHGHGLRLHRRHERSQRVLNRLQRISPAGTASSKSMSAARRASGSTGANLPAPMASAISRVIWQPSSP